MPIHDADLRIARELKERIAPIAPLVVSRDEGRFARRFPAEKLNRMHKAGLFGAACKQRVGLPPFECNA